MGFFSKNPNEVNYPGGKKHFTDVIKNSSPAGTLIWLNPEEDFNTNSTLIVAESEEALFFKDGVIEQVFVGGKYKLDTNNYPFLSRLRNAFSGGISTFNCKVYFVNKAHTMEIKWGTDTPIQMRDPVQGIVTSVQARGAYRVQIEDSKKFLIKMVGSRVRVMTDEDLKLYFRSQFSQYIKSAIASYIKNSGEEILGICAAQDELAEKLTDSVTEAFDEYGIRLVNFSVGAIDIPLDDPGRAKLEAAFAERRQQQILGYSWAQQQSAQIMHEMAKNQGDGGLASAGTGLGMGMAAAGMFHNLANQMFEPMQSANNYGMQANGYGTAQANRQSPGGSKEGQVICPSCRAVNGAGAKFCNSCGAKLQQTLGVCPSCGTDNQPGAKFCCNCGKPLGQSESPKKKFCQNCGAEIRPGMRFCGECGMQVGE